MGWNLPTFPRASGRGPISGAWIIVLLFLPRALRSGKMILALVLAAMPILLVGSIGILFDLPDHARRGGELFDFIGTLAYLQFLTPYISLLFGSYAISEEMEGRTAVFLITRPVSKLGIAFGKWLIAAVCTVSVLFLSLVVFNLVLGSKVEGEGLLTDLAPFYRYAAACCAGALVYTAVFSALGAWVRKALLVGLLITSVWEVVVANVPAPVQGATIMYYCRVILVRGGDSLTVLDEVIVDLEALPGVGSALLVLGSVLFVGLLFTAFALRFREYSVEQ